MATIAVVPAIKSSSPELIAPRWHTVLFVALFLALTLGGAFFQREDRKMKVCSSRFPLRRNWLASRVSTGNYMLAR